MHIIIFLLLLLFYPSINIAQTNNYIIPISNPEFSDSIVILNGSNNIFVDTSNTKNRGISSSIDWDQVPDFGFPKDEIHTIKIIRRSKVTFNNNIILLSPNVWRFEADSWTFDYYGSIPYLENLEFLSAQDSTNLTTSSKIELVQNPIGYYQDKNTSSLGFYQAINELSDNLVSSIFLISKQENILIDQYTQQLDEEILQDQTPTNTNNISEEELTNIEEELTNIEEELTNIEEESKIKNYVTNTTDALNPTRTNKTPIVENRKTFNTSIDKKQQNIKK